MSEELITEKAFDITKIREDFPVLNQEVNGKPLIYFDNAATTQKPLSVINALSGYYSQYNSNIHRGAHFLADKATSAFEAARESVRSFINANEKEEVIFTYGTTDAINIVAGSLRKSIKPGDEIIISALEHHSNIVPWQMLCEEKGAILKVIPIDDDGTLNMNAYEAMLSEKTRLVAVVYISNALGVMNPVGDIIDKAHKFGAITLIDAAQAAPHMKIDVQHLNSDLLVFSVHKMFGPTGVGILYGKRDLLEQLPPYRGGGEMIKEVSFEKTTYNDIPYKFEAGTPNIADVIAVKEAVDYMGRFNRKDLMLYEDELYHYAEEQLSSRKEVKIYAYGKHKLGSLSFNIKGMHHFDVGVMLDSRGIAIRTGHHCTQPLMKRFGIDGTARASFSIYNTKEEVDIFMEGIDKAIKRAG